MSLGGVNNLWLFGQGIQKNFVNCLDVVHSGSQCISILSHYYLSIINKALQTS